MKLSIITINLNNLDGLKKTIRSVVDQTWKDFEYLVIDGGSKDGSAEYISKISIDLAYWVSEKDRGIYHAMNKGIEQATGDYLLFLNSGDYLADSGVLEAMHGELTGEGIIYGDLTLLKSDGTMEVKEYPDSLTFSYVREQSLPHPASFINRHLFEELGRYNEKVRITADWQFFMLALFVSDTDYRHVKRSVTVFNLNGICNHPKSLKRIEKEKDRFISMKILVVGMPDSIHTARWLKQLTVFSDRLWIFPVFENKAYHPEIPANMNRIGSSGRLKRFDRFVLSVRKRITPAYYSRKLAGYIRRIKPDILHSLETQGAGYLVSDARKRFKDTSEFPTWWHTNWGSDIYLFGRLADHRSRIREVIENCNYYSCEGQRDVTLAMSFGLRAQVLPIYPNSGGFNLKQLERLRQGTSLPSARKVIMLKGYQGWAGRALVGIRSLERCSNILNGYTVIIYCNTDAVDVKIAAELLAQSAGIEVKRLPETTPKEQILSYHGQARISIGLSISDAISTSLLEAMAMGSFPIQSETSCASEWITDGVSGFIVPPEDPEVVEQAIRKALGDDHLVDTAAGTNLLKIMKDANYDELQDLTIRSYFKIFKESRSSVTGALPGPTIK